MMKAIARRHTTVKTGFFANFPGLIRKSRREAALVGAAAVTLLLLTGFSVWPTQRVLHDAETADGLNAFNARLTKFVQLLRTAESSQRGFLLTQDPAFLKPYHEIAARLQPMARELQTAAPTTVVSQARIAIVFQPLAAKLQEMSEVVSMEKQRRERRRDRPRQRWLWTKADRADRRRRSLGPRGGKSAP